MPSLAVRMQVGGLERRLTEERVGALVLEGDELAQDDPGRRRREAAERLELGLALVAHEVADDGAQVLEVEEGEAVLVGVVEDEPEARLLGVVEPEDLGEQRRAEVGDRRADRHALALATEREELRRVCRGLPVLPDVLGSGGGPVAGLAGARHAGQVALDVGEEDRDTLAGELLGHELEGLGLAGAGGAGDEPVPVEDGERDLDRGVGVGDVVDDGGAEVERRAVEGVAGADLVEVRRRPRRGVGGGLSGVAFSVTFGTLVRA